MLWVVTDSVRSPGTRAAPAYISTALPLMGPGEGPELRGSCLRLGTSRTQHYLFLSVCPESHSSFIISKTAAKLSGIAPRFHFSSFNCAPSHSTDQQANNNTQKRNEELLVSRPGWGYLLLKSWEQSQIHLMVGPAMGGGAVLGFCNLLWEMRLEDWNLKERIFQFHIAGHKSPYGEIDSTLSPHHTPLHLPSWPPQLEIYKSRARPGFIFFHPGKGILRNGFSDMSFLNSHSFPPFIPPTTFSPSPKWECFNEQLAHFSAIFICFPKSRGVSFFLFPLHLCSLQQWWHWTCFPDCWCLLSYFLTRHWLLTHHWDAGKKALCPVVKLTWWASQQEGERKMSPCHRCLQQYQ